MSPWRAVLIRILALLQRKTLIESKNRTLKHGGSTGFFLAGYLTSLSINYVAMSKDMEKRLPQLYYIKMKISCDLGFIAIGVAMAT